MNNKSYCPLVFKEIYNDSNGNYKLCCHAKPSSYNMDNMSPFEFFNSEYIENIRNRMYASDYIDECETCYSLEKSGNWSFRNTAIDLYNTFNEDVKFTIKMHVIGSYCNLSCVMCSPYNSSSRRNEMREIWGENYKNIFKNDFRFGQKGISKTRWKQIIENIAKNACHVEKINMTGGEPLLMSNQWKLVNSISEKDARNIILEYDTNLTSLSYNDNNLFDLMKKYKKIILKVSCDHYGDKLHLLRYPIDVAKFEYNLNKVKEMGIDVVLHLTVNLLNVKELYEIKEYYLNKFGIETRFPSIVTHPQFLSVKNLSTESKQIYINMYEQEHIIVSEMKKPPYNMWRHEAKAYLDKLFNHRKINWKEKFNLDV